jgi:hypothetical protein
MILVLVGRVEWLLGAATLIRHTLVPVCRVCDVGSPLQPK